MRKIISVLSLSCFSYVSAMEPAQPSSMENGPFQKIEQLYQNYQQTLNKDLRIEIINGLNSLMQRNALDNDQAHTAEAIASALNAPTLLARLHTIGLEGQNIGEFKILPQELIHTILDMVNKGGDAKEILSFLTISKGFNKLLLNAPLSLDLSSYPHKITDDVISTIVSIFPNLKSLDLRGCNGITDAGLASLASLLKLQSLNLSDCWRITNAGLASLAFLPQLQSLNLTNCNITDKGFASLASLTKLQSLGLSFCQNITDEGLASLASLTKLQSLDLSFCQNITDVGIAFLAVLSQLESLDLSSSPSITDAAINEMKEKIPGIEIMRI